MAEPAGVNRVRLTGAERRAEILAAAQAVFTASGLGGARTSQIAEAAGVAESMLYKHFASKRELFDAAVTEPVEAFVQSVVAGADGLLDRDGPGSERFYRAFLETMIEVLPLLGVALFSDAEEGRRFYNASIVPLFDRYQEKVQRSLASVGGAAGRTPVDDGFLSRAVIGIMFLLALDATYRDGAALSGADRDLLAEKARSFVAGGLTGSGAGDLLRLLGSLPPSDDPPAAPDMVSSPDWSWYWSRRAEQESAANRERDELAEENATLRRILADQAIELRTLQDRLAEK